MVLFDDDPAIEYIARPNQDRMRFGNKIIYNEFSMRSKPIQRSDSCIVLGFGDSVVNGGALTDQDSLATSIVENRLGDDFRFLNVSSGSWGPDNCAAYLRKFGHYKAKLIVLFVNSHDAHDNMTFEKTVGVHESYPDAQYPLATAELIDKYLLPRLRQALGSAAEEDNLMINKGGKTFNTGFQYFLDYSRTNNVPLLIFHHAELAEVEQSKFNDQGEEIINFCKANNIRYISGLDNGESKEDFRDQIHINEHGQKRWSKILENELRQTLQGCI